MTYMWLHMPVELQVALILFLVQVANYAILVINYRATANGHMRTMVLTDGLCATFTFVVIRRIAKMAETDAIIPWLGYMLGGMVGSVIGMSISKLLHKQEKP